MEARGVPGVPAQYDAGINHGLGVPNAFYHFAFEAGSEAGLDEMRNALIARGVEVTDVVDHDWAKSIYFKDPNGVQLEYCCFTRNLNANDARMQERAEISIRRLGLHGHTDAGGEREGRVATRPGACMEGPGTAVRVTPSRQRADEWAVVLAAAGTPHWLRRRLDGWAVIVPPEMPPPPWRVSPPTTRRTPGRARAAATRLRRRAP